MDSSAIAISSILEISGILTMAILASTVVAHDIALPRCEPRVTLMPTRQKFADGGSMTSIPTLAGTA